jgi:hypothetical protein
MQQPRPSLASASRDLPDAELRRLAQLIAKELEALQGIEPVLLTAADVAAQYGVSRGWVYRHARELGGQRMGTGPKARLRFRARDVQTCLGQLQKHERQVGRAGPPTTRPPVELLPVGPKRRAGGHTLTTMELATVARTLPTKHPAPARSPRPS